jgi:osmotically-inducible protein OsmY
MVKGVRKVHDALTINFVTGRPDTNVREEIKRRLEYDVWIDRPSLLNIHVRKGTAILAGQVKSAYEKSRVSELAWVQGIREVNVDGVEVIERAQDPMIRSTRPKPTDQQIADALHMILSYDPRVSPFNIGIAVENGSVTLQGDVPFLSIKREAEQDVKNTLGVVSVNNQLNIQVDSTLLDQDIRTRVLKAFSHDPVLGKFSLGVVVRKGTALLTGIVDSYYERNHVENVTSRVSGVRALQNDITFSTRKQEKTDWEIQLDIENQVWWNPYLADQDIVAMVEDGKATLTGSVAYGPQRVIAEQQAFEAGASVVVNNLRVGKMSPS